MLPELLPTASGLRTSMQFLQGLTQDFSEADWNTTDACGHNPRWLVGHLTTYRWRVAGLIGIPLEPLPDQTHFVTGTSAAEVPGEISMRHLIERFQHAHDAILARLEALDPSDLAKPIGRTLPNGTDHVGGALAFLAWHEAYHLGQVALLRRLAGKPGLL